MDASNAAKSIGLDVVGGFLLGEVGVAGAVGFRGGEDGSASALVETSLLSSSCYPDHSLCRRLARSSSPSMRDRYPATDISAS